MTELDVDILTGLLIWAAEAVTLAVLLFTRWYYERDPLYLSWGGGFAVHGIGAALIAMRGDIPDFISIEIANTMVLAGIGLWVAGLMQLDRRPVEPYVAIPALIWIAGMFLDPVRADFSSRAILHLVAAMVGHAMIIGVLLYHPGRPSITRRVFACIIAIQLFTSALIACMVLVAKPNSLVVVSHSPWLFLPAAFAFVGSIVCGARLLTERSEVNLMALARTDPLTGVLNRRGLLEEFDRSKGVDMPDGGMIAFIHFDLDGFKQINDVYGHQAGDEVLSAFARIGSAAQRGRGSFGRMGGEEFASIVRVYDIVEAASIAEAIRTTLKSHPITTGEHRISVTVSAGISLCSTKDANIDKLLTAADKALYLSKTSGRDRTAVYTEQEIMIVPSMDFPSATTVTAESPSDMSVSQQVASLKRIVILSQ
jgi:diguanylate cyclase (GGDEF)-like protein